MRSGRLVVLAVASEAALALAGWGAARALGRPIVVGTLLPDVWIGVATAIGLAAINHAVLTRLPSSWIVNGVRAVYHEVLLPIFGRLDPLGILVIGAAAGVGEEVLFRGVLQPLVGWPAASVLFGLAHMGGRAMAPFAVWAAVMGGALGALAIATGGIVAPIVAHGVYDVLALAYVRRGARRREHQE